jgi:hypothetical protein
VEALSSAWTCPVCGASRNKLRLVTMMDDYLDEPKTIENAAAPFISVNPGEEFTEAAQSLQSKG